jgi:N utilization substance protein B
MSVGRRSARRQAVFLLYQQQLLGLSAEAVLKRAATEEVADYARLLLTGVAKEREAVERAIARHLVGWNLDRLGIVEKSILMVAAYELLWEADVPSAVVIDEAVELAKRFCSAEAGALINGVLGGLVLAEHGDASGEAPSKERI